MMGKSFKSAHKSLLIPFSIQHNVMGGSESEERHKSSEGGGEMVIIFICLDQSIT